jgi:Family of unknown function (DUF6159)
MGKFGRAWQLFNESLAVLGDDAEILLFPVMSGISAVLVGISFFIPLYKGGAFEALRLGKGVWQDYAALFAWYYSNFFIGIFFNGALAACANIRLSGGHATLTDGLRIAFSRVGRIALWALITATAGLFLRSMQERGGWVLRLAGAGLGLAWSLVTYLIVPVILFEDRGVFDSMYRSEELFHKTWGEEVAGGFGFGLMSFLLCLPTFVVVAFLWRSNFALAIILGFFYLLVVAVVCSAVKGVFTVALYRYATQGAPPPGFSSDAIDEALGGRRGVDGTGNPSW